jgi:hypothetical protein
MDERDAGAEIKESLKKSIKAACANAMMVDDKTVVQKMKNTVENLDGAHDAVLPNSLAFRILVSMLADQVGFLPAQMYFNGSKLLFIDFW